MSQDPWAPKPGPYDPHARREPRLDNPYAAAPPPTAEDPYAAPTARVEDPYSSDAEAVRREHINHETSLRSVGYLYWLGALMVLVMGVMMFSQAGSVRDPAFMAGMGTFFIIMALVSVVIGWGYRALMPWVRWVGGFFSVIGLLQIPFGTLINGYILYLMFSAKGARIFSPDYASIVAQTPHVKYQRGVFGWIVLGILGVIVLALLAVAVNAKL